MTEKVVPKSSDESKDKCRDSSTLASNKDEKIYHVSEISNYEFSDDNTLDEYSQTQDSMSEQYISTNRKKMWYCHPLSFKKEGLHINFCGKNWDHSALLKECDRIISSFMMFVC